MEIYRENGGESRLGLAPPLPYVFALHMCTVMCVFTHAITHMFMHAATHIHMSAVTHAHQYKVTCRLTRALSHMFVCLQLYICSYVQLHVCSYMCGYMHAWLAKSIELYILVHVIPSPPDIEYFSKKFKKLFSPRASGITLCLKMCVVSG